MHIHPPKPLHGWRAFFGEVGIVVLGILIALGLEQLVEAVRWHDKVGLATTALRGDLAGYAEQAAEQQVTAPCVDRQLDALAATLTAPGDFRPVELHDDKGFIPFTVRAPSRIWDGGFWRAVVSEGVSSHFDAAKRVQLEAAYVSIEGQGPLAAAADTTTWRLRSLARPLALGPGDRARLVEEIEEQRGRQSLMTLTAGQLLTEIANAGMMPPAKEIDDFVATSGTVIYCRAHGLPLGTIRRLPV